MDVTLDQPQIHTCNSCPSADDACVVPIVWFVVMFIPGSVTGLSADESSSAPALADSRGVFLFRLFVAMRGGLCALMKRRSLPSWIASP